MFFHFIINKKIMSKEIKLEKQEEKQKVLKAEIPFTEITLMNIVYFLVE